MLNHFSCIRLFSTLWTIVHQASFLVSATTSQGADFLPGGGGSTALLTPGFQTFSLQNLRELSFCCFNFTKSLVICYNILGELKQLLKLISLLLFFLTWLLENCYLRMWLAIVVTLDLSPRKGSHLSSLAPCSTRR